MQQCDYDHLGLGRYGTTERMQDLHWYVQTILNLTPSQHISSSDAVTSPVLIHTLGGRITDS